MQNQIDRWDDHQHARDLIQQQGFASSIIRGVRVIDERVLAEQLSHDQHIHSDNDRRGEQRHQNQTPEVNRQDQIDRCVIA